MKPPSSFSPLLLFPLSPLLLLSISLLLVACAPVQPEGPAALDASASPTPAEALPTDIPPTDIPEPPPTDTPEPTPEPSSVLQVAYVNAASDIVLWQGMDSEPLLLVPDSGATTVYLSEDGALLAYRKTMDAGQEELWVVDTNGGDPRLLMGVEDFRALDPSALGVTSYLVEWVPGTHILAFNTMQYVEGPGLFLYDDLHFLDADTGELAAQFPPGFGGNFVFSPDGQQYALIRPETISLLNTDGTDLRGEVLTYPYVLTYSEYQYYAKPVWSPDSNFLRVPIPPQDSLGDLTAPTLLWEIPTGGSPAVQTGAVQAQPFFIGPVQFSPDLSHIAYVHLPDPNDFSNTHLKIADIDGNTEYTFIHNDLVFSGWAPDSQRFVFVDEALQKTYRGEINGDFSPLADVPYTREVHWVDDVQFLFIAQSDEGWQIRLGTVGAGSAAIADFPDGFPIFDFGD